MPMQRSWLSCFGLRCETKMHLALTFGAVLLSSLLASCVASNKRVEQVFPLFIQSSDLPAGWYYDKTTGGVGRWGNEGTGTVSRFVQFRGTRDRNLLEVHVIHEVNLFPDADKAATSFARILKKETPTEDWVWPEQVAFDSKADQFSLVCLDLQSILTDGNGHRETHWCTAVGRYGTVVSIIEANIFEDQWLTFNDFERLLTMADARLAGARPQPAVIRQAVASEPSVTLELRAADSAQRCLKSGSLTIIPLRATRPTGLGRPVFRCGGGGFRLTRAVEGLCAAAVPAGEVL